MRTQLVRSLCAVVCCSFVGRLQMLPLPRREVEGRKNSLFWTEWSGFESVYRVFCSCART